MAEFEYSYPLYYYYLVLTNTTGRSAIEKYGNPSPATTTSWRLPTSLWTTHVCRTAPCQCQPNARDHLLQREGFARNPMISPLRTTTTMCSGSTRALGSIRSRTRRWARICSGTRWNYGQSWTTWTAYEDVTSIDNSLFDDDENWWTGEHIIVQCKHFLFL